MAPPRSSLADLIRATTAPFALAAAATAVCAFATGATLGLYFGGVALAAILIPPLAARHDRPRDAFLAAASVIDGVGVFWLVFAFTAHATLGQWLAAYVVLATVGMAMLGLTLSLRRAVGPTIAAAVTTTVSLAWFAWPVWLSPFLGGRIGSLIVAWLAPAHPLLALNHVFIESGIWTQQPLMYQLTTLGQDVPFALPSSILACVFVHAIIALALGLPVALSPRPAESGPRRSAMSPAP